MTLSTAALGNADVALGATPETVLLLDGETKLDEETAQAPCVSASAWDGARCRAFARRLVERAPTPFVEGGRAVTLEVVLFLPLEPGHYPAVLFHHGSTGNGRDPALFKITYTNEAIARFFTERGFLVAFAQRRGRGQSDGLYDEGFTPDRSAYSCLQAPALAGFEHALQDAEAARAYVSGREDVDGSRLIVAGVSRGGVLAVAQAGLQRGVFDGVVNFVGGWLGEGCIDAVAANRAAFLRGVSFDRDTLWLYGENDSFYSLNHSRSHFDAYVAAGGRASFLAYRRAATLNGHFIIDDPELWAGDLDSFVRQVARE
jgi:dienelactone hydrolase